MILAKSIWSGVQGWPSLSVDVCVILISAIRKEDDLLASQCDARPNPCQKDKRPAMS